MTIDFISTNAAPAAVGPYSQAVRAGETLYVSEQIPLDPTSGKMVEGGAAAQAERCLQNIQAIVEAAGGTLTQIVKTTVYLDDMSNWAEVNEAYGRFFNDHRPARAALAAKSLPLGAQVGIEAIAYLG